MEAENMIISQWLNYPVASDRVLSMIGIEVHWSILQYVLGLPFMAFLALIIYAVKKDETWKKIALTLTKGFVLVFAVGAATGTGSEFGLVLLWPNLTEAAGRYIYFPLYAEIFAFLMEVIFIYMLYYGWNRFKPWALVIVALLAFSGAWFSASQIVSVNSYMVAPTGIPVSYTHLTLPTIA
jgi:cytochrome d ubiquinol oxidase subunit I